MHGLIHVQLRQFVESRHGVSGWHELNRRAGLDSRAFTALGTYPDADMTRLVSEAANLTGMPVGDLLEAFGEFVAPTLLNLYSSLVKPGWRTLDLLEHTERTIHRVVRARQPGAAPPELSVWRTSKTEVIVTYASQRRMCGLARGIIRGVSVHYDEQVQISEQTCMLQGANTCQIRVRLLPR